MDQTFLYLVLCLEACAWILQNLSQSPCIFYRDKGILIKVVWTSWWLSSACDQQQPGKFAQVHRDSSSWGLEKF